MLQKIPLKLVQQKFRARKKHQVHLPIQLRSPISSQQLMIVCNVNLLILNNPFRHLLKHVESRVQLPKSQQLLVRSRVNLETQNVSWTEKNSRPFRPFWFDHDEWKTWLHCDQEKDVSHASKLSSKI